MGESFIDEKPWTIDFMNVVPIFNTLVFLIPQPILLPNMDLNLLGLAAPPTLFCYINESLLKAALLVSTLRIFSATKYISLSLYTSKTISKSVSYFSRYFLRDPIKVSVGPSYSSDSSSFIAPFGVSYLIFFKLSI